MIGALLLALACGAADEAEIPSVGDPDEHAGAVAEPAADEPDHAHAASGGQDAQALLPIMRRLGADLTALTYALMAEDWETAATSAAAMADHAPISADEIERIQATLGEEMEAFEELDEAVHHAAVELREATRARDTDAVLEHLFRMQRGCVACHTQFRVRLRTTND